MEKNNATIKVNENPLTLQRAYEIEMNEKKDLN